MANTTKERVWLEEYFHCGFNATEAARRAGYKWPGKVGPRKAQKFAAEIQAELTRRALSADEVLARLSDIARAEYSEYLEPSGTVDLARMLEDGKGYLIKGTKFVGKDADQLVIEFYDAQGALGLLAKHCGLIVERHDLTTGGERIGSRDVSDAALIAALIALERRLCKEADGGAADDGHQS